jgi:protein-S-isoprenylcysteine O-methyltransferase Ste14
VVQKRGLADFGHVMLRTTFAICLALSQFTASRTTFFSTNLAMLGTGAVLTAAGIWLWIAASSHLRRAIEGGRIARTGPYRAIRHPIYASIYLLSGGMGLVFFARLWFVVLAAFLPLWWLECRREEQELVAKYGQAYEAYRRQTKLWIPGVW